MVPSNALQSFWPVRERRREAARRGLGPLGTPASPLVLLLLLPLPLLLLPLPPPREILPVSGRAEKGEKREERGGEEGEREKEEKERGGEKREGKLGSSDPNSYPAAWENFLHYSCHCNKYLNLNIERFKASKGYSKALVAALVHWASIL